MTNREKAREIASRTECNNLACWQCKEYCALEMAKWKDKQYPHWNKQEENDIYFSFDDWKFHKFVCIMKDSQVCTWTGIKDESADGHIETHLVPDKEQYTIDDVVYWTEIII